MDAAAGFDGLVGELDYSMLIVTASVEDRRAGCLVGFATQTSIDPARFLVCLSRHNSTYRTALGATALAVHFVPAGADGLAQLFGGQTGDELDKFARCAWHAGPRDLPILDDCDNWFAGAVLETLELGDHVGFVLEPFAAHHASGEPGAAAFTFHRAKRIQAGHDA